MRDRLLTGWTFSRWLYLAVGCFVLIQSMMDRQWLGVALGGYFAAMGLFAFGCASGNCAAIPRTRSMEQNTNRVNPSELD